MSAFDLFTELPSTTDEQPPPGKKNAAHSDGSGLQKDLPIRDAGKAVAVALYCYGVVDLTALQSLFEHHGCWRGA